eukprot:gene4241-4540_t
MLHNMHSRAPKVVLRRRYANDYSRKSILITGASSGIGKELALQYAAKGARLALAARRKDMLDAVAKECRKAGANETHVHVADVSDLNRCASLIEEAVGALGRLDYLVLNAGQGALCRFDEVDSLEIYEKLMQINYLSCVHMTHKALPHLKASRGHIIVVSSLAGKFGTPL